MFKIIYLYMAARTLQSHVIIDTEINNYKETRQLQSRDPSCHPSHSVKALHTNAKRLLMTLVFVNGFMDSSGLVVIVMQCLFLFFLQCFETVGWAAGRASGL